MNRPSAARVRLLCGLTLALTPCLLAAPPVRAQGGDDDAPRQPAVPKEVEALSSAARDGDMAKVKQLLARGVNINARGFGQHTALMAAASYGEAEMVKFLLSKGADPNLKDAEGRTALVRAQQNSHTTVVAVLQPVTGAARVTAPTARPAPRPAATAPASTRPAPVPAGRPAPAAMPRLPRLAPRPGYVIGRAVFMDGRPIPSFTVQALGFYGKLHLGPTGTLPFLGDHKKASGRYAIQTRDYAYTKEPVDALVSAVSGLAHIMYRGKEYALRLHPLDGKIDGSDPKAYRGRSGPGAVRDFVLKMSGVRPGYEIYNTPLTGVEDNGGMMNTYYGGTVNVSLAAYEAGTTDISKNPPGTVVTLTFTPLGPLMDGSAGQVITRSYRYVEKGSNWSFVTRDIPLGAYTATATLTEPGGASYPLRLKTRNGGGEYAASQTVEFAPYALYLGGVERVDMTLTR
jgi:hypothetical protein